MLNTKLIIAAGVVVGLSVSLAAARWVSARTVAEMRAATALPDPATLDSMARYLKPSANPDAQLKGISREPVPSDLPSRDAGFGWEGGVGGSGGRAARPAPPRYTVTAILITDARRVAVVNGTAVGVGDGVGNGMRVTAIDPEQVVIEGSGRRRRVLTVQGGR